MASASNPTLNKEQRRHLLRTMLESRHGDLREESLNRQGKGHFHVSGRGHEGMCALGALLRDGDYVSPYYRDRGLCMARGMTTAQLALEYFAKRPSTSRGRMMPSHFSSRELNIISVPTPTGAQLVPACGVAWGLQLDGKDGVVVTCIGDAATRQGDFYEAVNFALERKLPVIMVVEDNAYGISTPTRKTNPLFLQSLNPTQWQVLDGSDPEAVHAAAKLAIERARKGEGPSFLWTRLERLSSHTSSDDHTLYRSKEDIAALATSDPISVMKKRMIAAGELTEKEFSQLEAGIKEKVRADYAAAEAAENPSGDDLFLEVMGDSAVPHRELFPAGRYRMGDVINRTLRAGLEENPGRMIFGEDVEDPKGGVFRLTQKLSTDFPTQVFNSPLAESTIIGLAGGLAMYGRRPVFEIQFIDFIYPGFNQLVSNLANMRWRSGGAWTVPAVFYAPYGAYLPGGALWHSQANEAVFAHFPGINVVIPSTPEDAAGLLWTAMHGTDITLFLAPKHMLWAEHEVAHPVVPVPFGKARRLAEGGDVTVVAWGNTVEKVQEALTALHGKVAVDFFDLRSISPWDQTAIEESVTKTGRLVVVQEDTESCSVGQMIIQHITGHRAVWSKLVAPPQLVSKGGVMIGYNPIYEYAALPDAKRIAEAIRRTAATTLARGEDATEVPVETVESGHSIPPMPQSHGPQNTVVAGTGDIIVRVPIMGEGLRSARVVSLNKKPGDPVKHDDVLCEVETDKAVYPIEASFAGKLKSWQIKIDDTVLIGQEIALVTGDAASVAALPTEKPVAPAAAAKSAAPAPSISSRPAAVPAPAPAKPLPSMSGPNRPPALHPAITKRLGSVVPANILMDCRWDALRKAREEAKSRQGAAAASPSAMMAWCVVRAMEKHAAFRCVVDKDGVITEQKDFDFGVAVALEGDRLATAAMSGANRLAWPAFTTAYQKAVDDTRAGKVFEVQAPLNLTSLGAFGVESATPIVVPPAMGTLFIGTAHERMINDGGLIHPAEVVTLSLTFDHRVVNGAGAAAFMMDLRRFFEAFKLPA
ncbi:MAG TPA: thiamine pyrophosphate-dependent enzyme [Candidatus Didemnitutus sp.]|nr:thiamine pyrophosphate-dependent enzyme [Candidatus Didemnitutus sp.]